MKQHFFTIASFFFIFFAITGCQKINQQPVNNANSNLSAAQSLLPVEGTVYYTGSYLVQGLNVRNGAVVTSLSYNHFGSDVFTTGPLITDNSLFIVTGKKLNNYNIVTQSTIWQILLDSSSEVTIKPLVMDGGYVFVFLEARTFGVAQYSKLLAIDETSGQIKWSQNFGFRGEHAAPTISNGSLFVTDKSFLYALDETTGNLKWRTKLSNNKNNPITSPCVINNIIYAASNTINSDTLYAINASTGSINWKYDLGDFAQNLSAPAYYKNSIFLNGYNKIIAIDALAGTKKWDAGNEESFFDASYSPLTFSNDTVFTTVDINRYVCAFSTQTGNREWKITINSFQPFYNGAGAVALNNAVYLGYTDQYFNYFQSYKTNDGSIIWTKNPASRSNVLFSPVISLSSGQVIYSSESGMQQ